MDLFGAFEIVYHEEDRNGQHGDAQILEPGADEQGVQIGPGEFKQIKERVYRSREEED